MSKLREGVRIITASGELLGHLYVGADGLPELVIPISGGSEVYRPATFPNAYDIQPVALPDVLFTGWCMIEGIQEELRQAEREAEDDDG